MLARWNCFASDSELRAWIRQSALDPVELGADFGELILECRDFSCARLEQRIRCSGYGCGRDRGCCCGLNRKLVGEPNGVSAGPQRERGEFLLQRSDRRRVSYELLCNNVVVAHDPIAAPGSQECDCKNDA